MAVIQQQYFGELDGCRVFFAYHPPAEKKANGTGILICDAMFEEKQDSRRAMVNFANLASEAGFGVLRFDYRGHGESEGDFSDFSPEDTAADIAFAYRELHGKSGISRAGILGVRFGCNLAVTAAVGGKIDPEFHLLWAPEVDSKNYAEMILRSNLTNQLIVYRKVVEDRKVLVKKMQDGEVINVDGYGLNLQWYQYISSDRFAENLNRCRGKILVMDLDPRADKDSRRWTTFLESLKPDPDRLKIIRVKSEVFWKLTPIYAVRPKGPFEQSMEFLAAHV